MVHPTTHEIRQTEVKARIVTGTYILQTHLSKFNQQKTDTTCRLCREGEENIEHFILKCNLYSDEKMMLIQILLPIACKYVRGCWDTLEKESLILQLTLGCTPPPQIALLDYYSFIILFHRHI